MTSRCCCSPSTTDRAPPWDGLWAYILDQNDSAFRKPNARRAFWLDEPQKPGGSVVEYDWSISPRMENPGDWNTRDPSLEWYDGPIYFHRRFQAPADTGGRRFLSFEAVNYDAVVWLNGQEIGRHEGGFTPFVFEVTGKLKPGENVVVLRVDDRVGPCPRSISTGRTTAASPARSGWSRRRRSTT